MKSNPFKQFDHATDALHTGRRMVPKSEDQKKKTNVETVLQNLSEKTKVFERVIGVARDHAIQRVDTAARYTAMRATLVHHDITENHKTVQDQIHSLESVLIETFDANSRRTTQEVAKLYEQNVKRVIAEAEARVRQQLQDEQVIAYKNEMMAVVLESSSKLV